MTFPRQPADEPKTIADHMALVPAGLRELVEREMRAGNKVREAGTGFPAAPVGFWIQMQNPFLTLDLPLPDNVRHLSRPGWEAPGECTDLPRHFFVLSGPLPEPPPKPLPAPLPPSHVKHRSPLRKSDPASQFDWREQAEQWNFDLRVSTAIAKHLGLLSSKEMDASIIAEVGETGLKRVNEIDSFANREGLWTKIPHARAYQKIQYELKEKFPFLSSEAIQRLSTRAAWSWR